MALKSLKVVVGADISEFAAKMKQVGNEIKSIERQFAGFKVIGDRLQSAGKAMTAAITLPIVGAGLAAGAAAVQIDEALKTIRAGTGATGENLAELGQIFRSVFGQVPQTADQVAATIASLNTRLGLTGPRLQEMAVQMLNLARITKSDVQPLIASVTRIFGDWAIKTEDQAAAMDYLYKTSQQTGISVTALGEKMVFYGAPLRQMGFDFQTAAALVGKFEKEGVNAELVLGSLRIALTRMAKEGVKDPSEALKVLIERIKNAGSAGQANLLAMETFGARAGPDMAAAIREGRFELDNLLSSLENSNETINQAAAETLTFKEAIGVLKNQMTVALEPIGVALLKVFDAVKPHLEKVIQLVTALADWFGALDPKIQGAILAFFGIVAAIGPALIVAGKLISVVGTLGPALLALGGPIGWVIAAIAALAAGIAYAWSTNEQFRKDVQDAWAGIRVAIEYAMKVIGPIVQMGFKNLTDFIATTASMIADFVRFVKAIIDGDWAAAWAALKSLALRPLEYVHSQIKNLFEAVKGIFKNFGININVTLEDIEKAIKKYLVERFQAIVDGIKKKIETIAGFFKGLYDAVVGRSYIPDLVKRVQECFAEMAQAMEKYTKDGTDFVSVEFLKLQRNAGGAIETLKVAISKDLAAAMAKINTQSKIFGKSFDDVTARVNILTQAINYLIDAGFNETDPYIQQLRAQLSALGVNLNQVATEAEKSAICMKETFKAACNQIGGAFASMIENIGMMWFTGAGDWRQILIAFLDSAMRTIISASIAAAGIAELVSKALANMWNPLGWIAIAGLLIAMKLIRDKLAADLAAQAPAMAEGGIITAPTMALIGEGRGPEAVIPLERIHEFTGIGGGDQTIIIQLDGRVIAQTTVRHMPGVLRLQGVAI